MGEEERCRALLLDQDLEFVGEDGGETTTVLASKILLCSISPLILSLVKRQGFCSGCVQRTTIILPWANCNTIRIFMDLIQAARTDHSHHTDLSEHRIELTELMAQLKISPHIQVSVLEKICKSSKTREEDEENPPDTSHPRSALSSQTFPNLVLTEEEDHLQGPQIQEEENLKGLKRKMDTEEDRETNMNPFVKIKRMDVTKSANINSVGLEVQASSPARPGLVCARCSKDEFPTRTRLYQHYAFVHFKAMMIKFTECKVCPFCNKALNSQTAITHIAATHSYVERFLSPQNRIQKSKPGAGCKQNKRYAMSRESEYKSKKCETKDYDSTVEPLPKRSSTRIIKEPACKCHCSPFKTRPKKLKTDSDKENVLNDTVPQSQKSSKIQNMKAHSCYVCNFSASSRKNMYGHYATVHFKEDILAELNGSTSCMFCDKQFSSEVRLDCIVKHIGITHSVLEKFLSPEYHIKTKEKPKNGRFVKPKDFVCNECDYETETKPHLYRHYACRHYSLQIEEMYGDCDICPFCSKQLSVNRWIRLSHLGVAHNVVEQFIDGKSHIPWETTSDDTNLLLIDDNINVKKEEKDSNLNSELPQTVLDNIDVESETVVDNDTINLVQSETVLDDMDNLVEFKTVMDNIDNLVEIKLDTSNSEYENESIDIVDNILNLRLGLQQNLQETVIKEEIDK